MKDQYVSGLTEGAAVDSQFAVRSRDLRAARTGDAYLALELSDRTGSVPAVMFRPGPQEWSIPPGTVATVRGTVTTYRGVRRVSVSSMRPAGEYERRDMIASGSRQEAELLEALAALIGSVRHTGLRAVLASVFDDGGFMERFKECPASRRRHHAYAGGLLEHTVSVASLCRSLVPRYDGADHDLLVTAALLHDVGKVDELSYDTTVDLTDAGRLLGHVVLGQQRVSNALASVADRVASPLGLRLLHLVVSHHGEREWGAPVRPAALEAVLLHHADHLDAEAAGFMQAVAGAGALEEAWTSVDNPFGRHLVVPESTAGAAEEPVLAGLCAARGFCSTIESAAGAARAGRPGTGAKETVMALPQAEIGVFGGSGFHGLLDDAREHRVDTPYGAPSSPVMVGELAGRTVAFLPRHGRAHELPPHMINYRANVWAMKALGVTRLIGPNACGSLQPDVKPGHFVICDQFVDRTWGRKDTFYDGPTTTHVSSADPYCPVMRQTAIEKAASLGITAHPTGTVVVIQGPRFSTRSESKWFASQGWEVINMTQYPECYLARELEICYCNISLITDHDVGAEGTEPVSNDEVIRVFNENNAKVRDLICAMIPALPRERACVCASALDGAAF